MNYRQVMPCPILKKRVLRLVGIGMKPLIMHVKHLPVAKIARMDLLQDIHQSLITAMEKGQTLRAMERNYYVNSSGKRLVGKENRH
ncbi:hypothetical protein [Acinetobacter baumannii]|uniref:hypothetical protein n=1 Tax=Acinetobacter baumannii TaxID=470 RepID=UPI003873A5BE